MNKIAECIALSAGLQQPTHHLFLSHKVVADIECVFPEFVGEVTVDSVFLGNGSLNGLKSVIETHFDNDVGGGRTQAASSMEEKFAWVHKELALQMQKLCDDELACCGFTRCKGKIVSTISLRPFSPTDTEHVLCKTWLCMMTTHASRNISNKPTTFKEYCWPARIRDGKLTWWESMIALFMDQIWAAYLRVCNSPDNWLTVLPDFLDNNRFGL